MAVIREVLSKARNIVLVLTVLGALRAGAQMKMENELIRVECSAHTGGFLSIYDKQAGRECISVQPEPMLFRVIMPDGKRLYNHCDSENAAIIASNDASSTMEYQFGAFDAEVHLALDGPAVTATMRIRNTGSLNIEEVQFPWVMGLCRLPNDQIVTPSFSRRVIRDPLGEGLDGDRRHAEQYLKKVVIRYPERMTSAWCDYGNEAYGLTIEGRHTCFSIMDFFIHKSICKSDTGIQRSLNLAASHPVQIKPGETWQSPPVRISAHQGDWHAAADAHREWVETWVKKPERPAKFAEAIGWHYFFMKHQDGFERFTYDDLPKMAQAALSAGCPYLMLFGWHSPGHDNEYMYGYHANAEWGGAARLRANLEKIRGIGVEAIPFFNGTLANIQCAEHRAFGHRWEARTREGAPYYAGDWTGFNLDAPGTTRGRIHHEICVCDEQREYFLETARRIVQEYGFHNLQLDQIAIKMMPCYNEAHNHGRPDRAYVDGLSALLPQTRSMLRQDFPEGVIIGEGANEFAGQWCDGAWTWDFLFFPEPVLYSVPWLYTSTAVDALEYAEVNKAFAYKISLDMRIRGGEECVDQYPTFAAHVKQLAELRKRAAPYYVYSDFRDQQGIRECKAEGVIVKVFINRETGNCGIVLAELEGKEKNAMLNADIPRSGRMVSVESSVKGNYAIPNRRRLSISLQPYEAAIVCIPPPQKAAPRK